MKRIIKVISFFILLFIACSISGCFLFGMKGIFEGSNYQIVKLEIDNKVVLSPQELAYQAREQLQSNPNAYFTNPYDSNVQRQSSRIDDLNASFEQLKQRNQDDENDDESTPATILANITFRATFNLDRSQDMLYGKAGCNDYTAKFFWQDSTKIVISGAASTRKPCTPKEVAYFQNTLIRNLDGIYVVTKLKNRKGYVLNNGRMRIYIK
ncbi:META domain-containing protein [Helicobacter trogontum]|uniref:META domain-containing protein n=1 Tax=Helicobacter trogontum TaxID=50960 RepID=A0A4U8S5T3_9HELI|nr:META domain-containing protein [Helicobacter trogontum]TLD81190.1 META domain-containing protein [Helicobacter trogontum]